MAQPADSSAAAAAARSPRRRFKCQPCRKRARGGSPRVLARPAGPGTEKLSRAPPCVWAGAPRGGPATAAWEGRDAESCGNAPVFRSGPLEV